MLLPDFTVIGNGSQIHFLIPLLNQVKIRFKLTELFCGQIQSFGSQFVFKRVFIHKFSIPIRIRPGNLGP